MTKLPFYSFHLPVLQSLSESDCFLHITDFFGFSIATDVTFFTTVTVICFLLFILLDVTVILHFPVLIPFTYPDDETVAIFLLEDL